MIGDAAWSRRSAYDEYALLLAPEGALLGREVREHLVFEMAAMLPDLKIRALFNAKPQRFEQCGSIIAAFAADDGRLAGILTSRLLDCTVGRVLHVGMQLIAPRFRRGFLLKRMWGLHLAFVDERDGALPEIIAMRTCNPVVLQLLRGFTRIEGIAVYPDIGGTAGAALCSTAAGLAPVLAPGHDFDVHAGVLRGAGVPPDFYPEIPAGRDPAVDAYFRRHLTTADRMLCIVRIAGAGARERLLHTFGASTHAVAAGCA